MPSRTPPNGLRFRPRVTELEDRSVPATLNLTGTVLTLTLDAGASASMTGTAGALTFDAGAGHTVTANAAAQGLGFTTGAQASGPGDLSTVTALNVVGAGGTETFTNSTAGGTFPALDVAASVETTAFNFTLGFNTGADAQTYHGPVTLLADADPVASSISFDSTVNGTFGLNIFATAATTFTGAVGGVTPLTGLVVVADSLTAAAIATVAGVTVSHLSASSITGTISGGGGLTKNAAGTLTLSGANTYAGVTAVNDGTLVAASAGALGATGAGNGTAINGGTLDVRANIGTEPIDSSSVTQVSLITSTGSGTVGGPVSVREDLTIGGNGNLTISGVVSSTGTFALGKVGTGTTTLSGANTFTGPLTVQNGTVVAANPTALGATTAATTVTPGAVLDVQAALVAEPITVQCTAFVPVVGSLLSSTAGTVTGPVSLDSLAGTGFPVKIGGAGTLTVSGVISQPGLFTNVIEKVGAGTLTLGGANTFSGGTVVSAGVLIVTNPAALGTPANGTTVAAGATLNVRTDIGAEALSLAGIGTAAGQGALRTSTGFTGVVGGPVTLTADADIGGSGLLTISGAISGNFAVTKVGVGDIVLTAANTYTGATTITTGRLIVNGTLATSGVSVTGGTLGGGGSVGPLAATGGTIAPAAVATTPTTLSATNTTLGVGATFAPVVSGAAAAATGKLAVTGTLNVTGATLNATQVGAIPTVGQVLALIENDGADPVVGTFAGLPEGATVTIGGRAYTLSYAGGTGNDVVLTLTPPVVAAAIPPLVVSGQTNGSAALFVPTAGQYATTPAATLTPFSGFVGNVRTATADVDGDGTDDTVLVTGPGGAIRLAVVSGADNATVLVAAFDPFGGNFQGGGFVTAADIDLDGKDEFIVTPDQGGGPRVTIFSRNADGSVATRANFFGIDDPNFRGGARAALGDVDGDGTPDLAVSAGFLGGPRTALFKGTTLLGTPERMIGDFFAFPGTDAQTLRNGVFVAAGDVDGDGKDDLIFGGGPGGGPRVFILSGAKIAAGDVAGAQASPIANFFVAGNSTDRGGVRLAAKDADGDAKADVVAGSGEGSPSRARIYLGKDFTTSGEPAAFQDLTVFGGAALLGGVFVG